MQGEEVKEFIERDIWGNLRDFFDIIIWQSPDKSIKVTVGLILLLIIVFFITNIVLRGIRMFFTRKLEENDKMKFISVFKFLRYIIYLVVIILTLSSAGIDITILLTASAALFVGLGLALQELFQDVIGGVFIITDKTLRVGDIIEMNGKVGRVIDIRLRTTRVLTRDDKVMVIPNHKFK